MNISTVSGLPSELCECIYSFLVRGSIKSEQFKKEIREGWLKHRVKRVQNMVNNGLGEEVLLEMEQLFHDIDEMMDLDQVAMRQFYRKVYQVIMNWNPHNYKRWLFYAKDYNIDYLQKHIGENYVRYHINEERIYGYFILKENETSRDVQGMLQNMKWWQDPCFAVIMPMKSPMLFEYDSAIEEFGLDICDHGDTRLREEVLARNRPFLHRERYWPLNGG